MDHLRYYLGLLAKHHDVQLAFLVTPEFNNGLPASLVGNPDRKVNMGLKGLTDQWQLDYAAPDLLWKLLGRPFSHPR